MALTFDSSTAGTSTTVSHTIGSGDNRVLFVAINQYFSTNTPTATYGGVSMTSIHSFTYHGGDPDNSKVIIFKLVAPTVGTANIVISGAGGSPNQILSSSYFGADQTTQPEAVGTSATRTPSIANTWYVVFGMANGNTNRSWGFTTGSSVTTRSAYTASGSYATISDSNTAIAISTAYTANWNTLSGTGNDYKTSPSLTIYPAAEAPTVTTQAVTDIDFTTATGNGNVTSDGGATITERGVCWSLTSTPTTADSKATSAGTTGAFTASMTGMVLGTHYYVRAYAINAQGTSYGSEVEFDTDSVADNTLYRDISAIQDTDYAVRVVVGGTTGSITVKLGDTGDTLVIPAGTTGVLIGTYSGVNGIIIEASVDFDGTVDDVFWVRMFDVDATIDWDSDGLTLQFPINSSVLFRRIADDEFNRFRIYRYLDLKLKDLNAQVTVNVVQEASDLITNRAKQFSVGTGVENTVPFLKKKVSFLIKGQAILVGLSNNRLNETFTISGFQLMGYEQPKKLFAPSKIISMG